jgi:hypothetical protein
MDIAHFYLGFGKFGNTCKDELPKKCGQLPIFKNGFGHKKPRYLGLFWTCAHFAHYFFILMRKEK